MKVILATITLVVLSSCATPEQKQMREQQQQAELAQQLADALKECGVEGTFDELANDPFKQETVIECMKKSGYARIDNEWTDA